MPHDSDEENTEFSEQEVKDDHSYSSANPKTEDKLLSPLAESPRFLRGTSNNKKYEPSKTMSKFMDDVLPHMLSDTVTHNHPLDESMYGGTLTLGGKEVSFGQIMYGNSDSFTVPIPIMFSFIGAEGKNKNVTANNQIKSTFPYLNKARRLRSIGKFVAGTTDLTKLQEDVVLQCKSGKGHLNITVNDIPVSEELKSKPQMSDDENDPPVAEEVEQKADDTKESLFSEHADQPQESDYFATEHDSAEDEGSASPVFTVNNNADVDTSNEVIGPTQVDNHPNPISTLGLVEVDALSSPILQSAQPQHEENVVSTEDSNGHNSAQDADDNIDVQEEGVDDSSIYFPADDSSITNDDPFPFEKDITSQPFPEYNIPQNEQEVDNTSVDSGIHSSSSVQHEHDFGVEGNEHGFYGVRNEVVGDHDNIVNEDVIYNQEVITLNKNMDVKKNLGSDCVVQAQGETKLVVSVQSNVEKMKLVQKLFKESASFKGWSSELKKIPLVELDRCDIELVTDKNYTKYVTTVDGSLDVYLKGGEGGEAIHEKGQVQSVPETQTSNDNSDRDETSLNAAFEDAPSLESQSQVAHAMTAQQPESDDTKPAQPLRRPTARKRTANTTKPSKKSKTSDNRKPEASDPVQPKSPPRIRPRRANVVKPSKGPAQKPANPKQPSATKNPVPSGDHEAESELLLETLMRSEKQSDNGPKDQKFGMFQYFCGV